MPNSGASTSVPYPDGNDGIDNSFGKNLLPILLSLYPNHTTQFDTLEVTSTRANIHFVVDQTFVLDPDSVLAHVTGYFLPSSQFFDNFLTPRKPEKRIWRAT